VDAKRTKETGSASGGDEHVRTLRYEISLKTVFTILGIVIALWLLVRVWQSLLLLVIALVLAGTFSPVVTWLERHRVHRPLALTFVGLGLAGAVVGLGALVVPALVAQTNTIITGAPALQAQLADFVARLPVGSGYASTIRASDPAQLLSPLGASVVDIAREAATLVVVGVTTVVLAFYLIADHERVQGFVFSLLPRSFHLRTAHILLDMETVVGGYMRGQVLTSVAMGMVTAAVCVAVGTPSALAVAVIAAFADLVPFVGPALAIAPAVLLALTRGPAQALIVLLALMAYSQIETHVLVPRIYGQSLRLSPVAVIVALLMGGQILGIVGALLALPIAAGLRVLVEDLRIELPGELAGESSERAAEEEAEREYAAYTGGASSVESAVLATAIAEHLQEEALVHTGAIEHPAEEQGDPPLVAPTFANPAR